MRLLQLLIILCMMGCFSKKDESLKEATQISEIAQDILLPKALMAEIELELNEDSKLITPVYIFVPLLAELVDKSVGVIQGSPKRISFPKGGGRLDLKDVVTGQGSFYLSFPADQFAKLPDLVHLYYVSQSPLKKIGNESFGLGCGKWVDIKNKFSSLKKDKFFKLNTTDQRYLYVLAGHYVFVFRENNQVYLSQLTITDSRYTNELCNPESGARE